MPSFKFKPIVVALTTIFATQVYAEDSKNVDDNINADNNKTPASVNLDKIQIRAKRFHQIGPMPGLGLTKEEIPGNVQSITAKEIWSLTH